MTPEEKAFLQDEMDKSCREVKAALTYEEQKHSFDIFAKCAQVLQLDRIATALENTTALRDIASAIDEAAK